MIIRNCFVVVLSTLLLGGHGGCTLLSSETEAKQSGNRLQERPIEVFNYDSTFAERIQSCKNIDILNLITRERNLQGKSGRILPGHIEDSTKNNFLKLYQRWPEGIKKFCRNHILNIFIVKGLGSSGYTTTRNDFHFYIFLDERVVTENPNDWFNRTEATGVDLDEGNYSFQHRIESDSENYPSYTIENIIIHEIGHCLGVVKGITPTFEGSFEKVKSLKFFEGCFNPQHGRLIMEPEYNLEFHKLEYYSDHAKIKGEDYVKILKILKKSPFPTTYSTRSSLEFFAEYFYCYVHCIIQKKPCEYNVYKNNKLYYSLNQGPFNKTCKNRFQQIDDLVRKL